MSSNVVKENFFKDIFIESKANPGKLLPLLNSSDKIPDIFQYLNDDKNPIKNKINCLSQLIFLFKENKNIIPCFIDKITSKRLNLFEPLINLYLDKSTTKEELLKVEELIRILIKNITIPKSTLEFIYQKLSKFFTNEGGNNTGESLTENYFIKHMNLLKIFYGNEMQNDLDQIQEQNIENISNIDKNRVNTIINKVGKSTHIPDYKIKNYIYFNGKDSILNFKLNNSSRNLNSDYPTLEYGFSFIFWLYLKKELLQIYFNCFPSLSITLVNIDVVGHKIKLVLPNMSLLQIILDDKEICKIEISNTKFKFDSWNFMCFYLTQKIRGKAPFIKLIINDNKDLLSITLPDNFPLNEIINSISLFENLLGRITSVLFFSFCIDMKLIDYLRTNYTKGFYKNKYLFNFLYLNEKDYFKNIQNYKYCNKYKKERSSLKLLNTNFRNQNVKNLMVFFCPFTYNKNEKLIDDIFGHFLGIPGINDGVNYYENHSKSILHLGGISNLLPIAELLFSCKSKAKDISYPLIDKNLLTENSFYEFLSVFKSILINHPNNLSEAYNKKFFSKLGLFFEKFPSSIYTERILNLFLEIEKEEFQIQFSYETIDINNENFLAMILLNEKIISKFSTENQLKLWDTLYQFFTSDYSLMKGSLNMSKICLLLRFYDQNRYDEFCCSYHANLFKSDNDSNYNPTIMNPEMDEKLGKLFNIIQLYLDKLGNDEKDVNLFKLLLLDLSPCIQKKIIKAYYLHFTNNSISKDDKLKTIQNLLNNNFFDILEYVLSISLLDVRIELLILLDNLLKDYSQIINSHISKISTDMKSISEFIADNILPEQLIVEVQSDQNSIDKAKKFDNLYVSKLEPLSKYFNKNEYEVQIEKVWNLLKSWIFKNDGENQAKSKTLVLNELYVNFCIYFVSKNIITKYIYDFLLMIQEFLEKKDIINIYIFYEKDNFYQWLIETLFYFNNKENTKITKKQEIYEKIRINAITIFKEIFSKIKNYSNKLNKIQYILNFSYKLKNLANNNKSQINEIEAMTRSLLKILLENKNIDMDLITVACYEFMIFYKDCDKYTGEISKKKESAKKLSQNDVGIKRNLTSRIFGVKNNLLNTDLVKDDDDSILNIKIDYSDMIIKEEIIPDCIFESINYFGDINSKNKDLKMPLYKIWKDYPFYEKIINYYYDNIWGLDKLCEIIKEDPKRNMSELYLKLLKEYSETKAYKNILYNNLLKLLNNQNLNNLEKYPINILKINIQLLAIAEGLANDEKEKEKIQKKIHHLLIYCIISSVNINVTEKYYDSIQEKLYDIIGFSFILLKKINQDLFKDILNNLIMQIFIQEINEQNKGGFLKLFSKKNIFGNTCIFRFYNFEGKSFYEEKVNLRGSATIFPRNTLDPIQEGDTAVTQEEVSKDDALEKYSNELLNFKGDIIKLMKHGFQYSLIYFRNQKVKISFDDIKILYKYNLLLNSSDKNAFINDTKERKRIHKNVKKLVPFFENQIKKYSNTSFLSEKKRRNNYKSTKRALFSWCGFWSNKYLFYEHPELLKTKKMNHLTKEMTQLLMKPILDINYYMPNFQKFDKSKLFNENNYLYQINLDIDNILLDDTQTENNKNEKNSFNSKKNSYGFNYLESVYRYSYDDLWEKYKSYYEQNLNIEKIGLLTKASYDILISNKEISKDIEKMKTENIYYCCMVKLTHHIRGYASTEESRILFIYETEEYHTQMELENDSLYDKDMSSCFGSIFKGHQKDKDKINFEIKYNDIKYMFIKIYFYSLTAIEIYTVSNKSFLFTFKNNKDLTQFTHDILSHGDFREIKLDTIKPKTIGYEKKGSLESQKRDYFISAKYEEWKNYSISTLELLMWLNIYSGRSFNDLTQYPVFPWIVADYDDEFLKEESNIRDLAAPIGMLEINEKSEARKETFIEIYDSVKNDLSEIDPEFNYQEYLKNIEEYYNNYYLQKKMKVKTEDEELIYVQPNQLPYFFGTHYSNPTYVAHYLTRIFPFSLIAIEIQGEKFDDPDRLFTSMKKTFESATTLKDDVRELIPEFYYMPEMFMNNNNLNLSQSKTDADSNITIVNDVELPPWAMNTSYNFVLQLRKILENEKININKWIDLIFGVSQKGEKAEELHNIFMGNSYQGIVKIDSFKDQDTKNALMRMVEVGVTPLQLFDKECNPKIEKDILLTKNPIYSNSKGKFFYESTNISIKKIKSAKYKRICEHFYYNNNSSSNKDYKINIYPKIIKIKWLKNDYIKLFTNINLYYSLKLVKVDNKISSEESELCEVENLSSRFSPSYLISGIDIPMIIYNDNKYILKGGFWDGRIEISSATSDEKFSFCIFPNEDDPVVVMEMTKDENYLLCGTKKGFIIVYLVKGNNFEFVQKLYYHSEEITSISISNNLNMIATSSKDGFIMLYTFPLFKLVRAIKISINENENEFVFADKIFLSSSPIPCVTIYISSKSLFKTYSINGAKLYENAELENSTFIKCSQIIHDLNFQDILIYGTNNGFIKIRKFPDMSLVNVIDFLDGQPIETFALSKDHRYCFAYSGGDSVAVISDEESRNNSENKIA